MVIAGPLGYRDQDRTPFTEKDVLDCCYRHFKRYPTKDDADASISVILDSGGGSLDSASRTAVFLRRFASRVNVYVPRRAKSAATLDTLGADRIWMSPFAELGPLVLGAVASVFQRVSTESLVIDYTAPLFHRVVLGGLRPFVGGLLGLVVQLILVSGPMGTQPADSEQSAFAFFAVVGFIAGFSERFAIDMIERAGRVLTDKTDEGEGSSQATSRSS